MHRGQFLCYFIVIMAPQCNLWLDGLTRYTNDLIPFIMMQSIVCEHLVILVISMHICPNLNFNWRHSKRGLGSHLISVIISILIMV
jgi:hypothetical protein